MPEEAAEMLHWIVVEGNCRFLHLSFTSLQLKYACGICICSTKLAHQKLSSAFLSLYLTSCSGAGVCCEWVSAVGVGRGTSV